MKYKTIYSISNSLQIEEIQFSVNGILRDINVFYDVHLNQDKYHDNLEKLDINFVNECKDDCTNVAFLKIEIEDNIKEYKDDLEDYFDIFDAKKINFFYRYIKLFGI